MFHVFHPVYAPVHPCLCTDQAELTTLLTQGWSTSRETMHVPLATNDAADDGDGVHIVAPPDDIDDMVAEETRSDRKARTKKSTHK